MKIATCKKGDSWREDKKSELFTLCVTLFVPGDNFLMHASELRINNLPLLKSMRDYL